MALLLIKTQPALRKVRYSVSGTNVRLKATGLKVRSCSSEIRVWDSRAVLGGGAAATHAAVSHKHATLLPLACDTRDQQGLPSPQHAVSTTYTASVFNWYLFSQHTPKIHASYLLLFFKYSFSLRFQKEVSIFCFQLVATDGLGFTPSPTNQYCQTVWPFLRNDWSFHQTDYFNSMIDRFTRIALRTISSGPIPFSYTNLSTPHSW